MNAVEQQKIVMVVCDVCKLLVNERNIKQYWNCSGPNLRIKTSNTDGVARVCASCPITDFTYFLEV